MEYNISVDLCRQALPALRPMRTVRVAKLEDLKPAVEAHAVGDTKRTLLITAVPGRWMETTERNHRNWTETMEAMVKSSSKSNQ